MKTTVTREHIEQRVAEALAEFGVDRAAITPDAEFGWLDIDSLDLVELAQIVEEEYGVELRGEDMEKLRTVGQSIDLIVSRLG